MAVGTFVAHSRTAVPPSDTVTSSGVEIGRGGGSEGEGGEAARQDGGNR